MSTVTITVRRGSMVSSSFIRSRYWLRSWKSTGGFIGVNLLGCLGRTDCRRARVPPSMGARTGATHIWRGNAHAFTAIASVRALASYVAGRLRNRDGGRADEPAEGQQGLGREAGQHGGSGAGPAGSPVAAAEDHVRARRGRCRPQPQGPPGLRLHSRRHADGGPRGWLPEAVPAG